MPESPATVAEEEYLQTIFWLGEADLPVTGANIARAMQLSAPTVHEMVLRMADHGYIERLPDKSWRFTERGRTHAEQIVRRHRLIERFLTDVLDIPWDDVHEQAELMEHAMSPLMEEKMLAAIGDSRTCPHGHPIDPADRIPGVPLADCEVGAKVTIMRFENEAEDLLRYLKNAGVEPGQEGEITARDDEAVTYRSDVGEHTLTYSVAETVSVTADPSPPVRTALPEQLVIAEQRYGK